MAHQEASTSPGAEVVGRAFVEQYYHILHQSPGSVHRFYQDSSLLTRPDVTGSVTTVTTMQAINEKIMSLKYEDYTTEIETADAQESYERGVIALVTGCLTGSDNVRKRFSQTFFLAPQDKGYFVLNDVFRFLEEKDVTAHNGTTRDIQAPVEPERVVVSHEAEVEPEPVASIEEEDLDNVAEVYDPSDKDEGVVVDAEPIQPPPQLSHSEVQSVPQGDAPKHSYASIPKHSYASILKLMKSSPAPARVVARNKPRPAPVSNNQRPAPPPPAASEASGVENVQNSSNVDVEDDGHSIYVRNLPSDTTPTQLEEVFKSFGGIKHEGIQIRSNKQGFCFGFVEFETSSGKQSALEASPVTIGDRQVVLEEKKPNRGNSGGGGRGRYFGGRGSYRNESFKGGRGGGRGGYGRGEFSGRPKISNTRSGGEGYQRVPQNGGSGRGGGRGSLAVVLHLDYAFSSASLRE